MLREVMKDSPELFTEEDGKCAGAFIDALAVGLSILRDGGIIDFPAGQINIAEIRDRLDVAAGAALRRFVSLAEKTD